VKDTAQSRTERQEQIKYLGGLDGGPGPTEKTKMSIFVSAIEDLEDSINRNSEESSKLTKAIAWLNVVIAVATLALAIIGGTDLWVKFRNMDVKNQTSTASSLSQK
jgi:hypothetical protein